AVAILSEPPRCRSSRFSLARWSREQCCDPHEIVGEHSGADPQLEAVTSLSEAALHAAASKQHGDASLDAGAKALTILEGRTLLVCLSSRRPLAATLRNAHHFHAGVLAGGEVLFAEEATI